MRRSSSYTDEASRFRAAILRGVGVAMALPWLESIPVWGACNCARHARVGAHFPSGSPRCSWATASTRSIGGRKVQARRWSWARASNRWRRSSQDECRHRPLQQERHRRRHSSRADGQYPLRRAAPERRGAERRHQHGPGAGQPPRAGDGPAEHGARLRAAHHRLSRDQLLDGL